jgi:hypothetical protein
MLANVHEIQRGMLRGAQRSSEHVNGGIMDVTMIGSRISIALDY